jgi:hypothetical protein
MATGIHKRESNRDRLAACPSPRSSRGPSAWLGERSLRPVGCCRRHFVRSRSGARGLAGRVVGAATLLDHPVVEGDQDRAVLPLGVGVRPAAQRLLYVVPTCALRPKLRASFGLPLK